MTWNYRIVRYKNGSGFGLHEVFYNKSGKATAMTQNPISFSVDAEEGANTVISAMSMALSDAITRGVFDEPEKWTEN